MNGDWNPGDVGVTVSGRRAMFVSTGEITQAEAFIDQSGDEYAPAFLDLRRLVVIDPSDRDQVERLTKVLVEAAHRDGNYVVSDGGIHPDTTQAALRVFAVASPPKPAEPTGLGAVVEDAEGEAWVRNNPCDDCKWRSSDGVWLDFADIDAVRVLSEGVTE